MTDGSQMEPLTGVIVPAGQGRVDMDLLGRDLTTTGGRIVEARMGIGGPLDGKVLRSASTRLDYRKPTVTVVADFDTGVIASATADASPILTYLPKTIVVLGVRQYRIWVPEDDWTTAQNPTAENPYPMEQLQAEAILRLIDASPADNRACRQLP